MKAPSIFLAALFAANATVVSAHYYDAETGTDYNYFRDYDPSIGRYVESDPIGLKGGLNTYGYVENGPLSRIDPTGQGPEALGACAAGPVGCAIGICLAAATTYAAYHAIRGTATALQSSSNGSDGSGQGGSGSTGNSNVIPFPGSKPAASSCQSGDNNCQAMCSLDRDIVLRHVPWNDPLHDGHSMPGFAERRCEYSCSNGRTMTNTIFNRGGCPDPVPYNPARDPGR